MPFTSADFVKSTAPWFEIDALAPLPAKISFPPLFMASIKTCEIVFTESIR